MKFKIPFLKTGKLLLSLKIYQFVPFDNRPGKEWVFEKVMFEFEKRGFGCVSSAICRSPVRIRLTAREAVYL